jgi:PAS domain S-box-containing protein
MPEGHPRRAVAESPPALLTVFVVDDDGLVRAEIRGMLEDDGKIVEEYASCEAFMEVYRHGGVGCLVVDAHFPGMSGLELLRWLQTKGYQLPSIMITGRGHVKIAVEAMKAGASDFIEKPIVASQLLACIARMLVQAKDPEKIAGWRTDAADQIGSLTKRQREILNLILAGHRNKNIAADLGISQRTVEAHRAVIMKKAGVKSLPALARLAFAADQIKPSPQEAKDAGSKHSHTPEKVEAILTAPDLSRALESDQFKRFLDQIPLAIIVAEIKAQERITYANPEFERLTGHAAADIEGHPWSILKGGEIDKARTLGAAIMEAGDFVGCFQIDRARGGVIVVDVHSNIIENEDGTPTFRLAALVDVGDTDVAQRKEFEQQIREKDALLLEFQHRVKNNLQMITALIRVEAKAARGKLGTVSFDRLAGRINSIQLLYKLLAGFGKGDEIDLGVYLSEIVSSVMHSHAVEGIRLNLKVDAYPVSVNVAMPTGLVVNELMTNALKHAFVGRDGGTITLHSVSDAAGCRVVIADDGVGLPEGVTWPKQGKLGALIVRSLRENANADLKVESNSKTGTRVTISFTRAASAPRS